MNWCQLWTQVIYREIRSALYFPLLSLSLSPCWGRGTHLTERTLQKDRERLMICCDAENNREAHVSRCAEKRVGKITQGVTRTQNISNRRAWGSHRPRKHTHTHTRKAELNRPTPKGERINESHLSVENENETEQRSKRLLEPLPQTQSQRRYVSAKQAASPST